MPSIYISDAGFYGVDSSNAYFCYVSAYREVISLRLGLKPGYFGNLVDVVIGIILSSLEESQKK